MREWGAAISAVPTFVTWLLLRGQITECSRQPLLIFEMPYGCHCRVGNILVSPGARPFDLRARHRLEILLDGVPNVIERLGFGDALGPTTRQSWNGGGEALFRREQGDSAARNHLPSF